MFLLIDTPLLAAGLFILNLNYMRPANIGERLRASAELIRLGRRTAKLEVRIVNDSGKQLLQGSAILMSVSET